VGAVVFVRTRVAVERFEGVERRRRQCCGGAGGAAGEGDRELEGGAGGAVTREVGGSARTNERTKETTSPAQTKRTNVCVITRHLSRNERLLALLALPAPRPPPPPPPPHPSALLVTTRPLSPRSPPSRPRRSSDRRPAPGASTRDATRPSFKASDGVGGVVERRRSEESKGVIGSSVETEGRPRGEKRKRARERKSSRIDAHHADAVVRGPV